MPGTAAHAKARFVLTHTSPIADGDFGGASTQLQTSGGSELTKYIFDSGNASTVDGLYTFSAYMRNNHVSNNVTIRIDGTTGVALEPGQTRNVVTTWVGNGVNEILEFIADDIADDIDVTVWNPFFDLDNSGTNIIPVGQEDLEGANWAAEGGATPTLIQSAGANANLLGTVADGTEIPDPEIQTDPYAGGQAEAGATDDITVRVLGVTDLGPLQALKDANPPDDVYLFITNHSRTGYDQYGPGNVVTAYEKPKTNEARRQSTILRVYAENDTVEDFKESIEADVILPSN